MHDGKRSNPKTVFKKSEIFSCVCLLVTLLKWMGRYSFSYCINKEFMAVSVVPCWLFPNNLQLVVVNFYLGSSVCGMHAVCKQAQQILAVCISCTEAPQCDAHKSQRAHWGVCHSHTLMSLNYSPTLESHPPLPRCFMSPFRLSSGDLKRALLTSVNAGNKIVATWSSPQRCRPADVFKMWHFTSAIYVLWLAWGDFSLGKPAGVDMETEHGHSTLLRSLCKLC